MRELINVEAPQQKEHYTIKKIINLMVQNITINKTIFNQNIQNIYNCLSYKLSAIIGL